VGWSEQTSAETQELLGLFNQRKTYRTKYHWFTRETLPDEKGPATAIAFPGAQSGAQQFSDLSRLATRAIILPPAYQGKTIRLAVYDMHGALVRTLSFKGTRIDLQKEFGIPDGAFILKIDGMHQPK
jgi:hypothetical protein